MDFQKSAGYLFVMVIFAQFISTNVRAQTLISDFQPDHFAPPTTVNPNATLHYYSPANIGYHAGQNYRTNTLIITGANDSWESEYRKTTSLTVGYIIDEFSLESDDDSYRFRFNGTTTGLMLGSKSSSLIVSYGVAGAHGTAGDIRNISADLNLGGNITLFRRFLGLPIGSFIPIRFNMGYRNLELMDNPDNNFNSTANLGMGSLGGGFGTEIRIPSGLPVLKNNLTAFAHLVTSVGAIGDFTSIRDGFESDGKALNGIRLTKGTDFTFEAKFERLLGGKTGVTAGLTFRWLHWTDERADDVKQILDVISGEQEGLELRATQSFFRVGINW